VALTGLVSSASPAPAVFPGQNGPLAGGGCEPMNVYDCGLYLQTAAGTRRILKTGKLFVKEAQWSPDGKRIAYVIGSSTGTELRVVGADGRGDRLVLKETGELYIGFSSTDWSWMRDSRHIAFVSSHTFLKIDANATNAYSSLTTPLRGMYAIEVDASPVSDLLAVVYFNTEAQERGIALMAMDDNGSNLGIREFKRVRTLPWDADDNYASIGWAPDGRRLAFVHSIVDKSIGKGTARVEVVTASPDAPEPTPLTEYPKGTRDGAAYVEIARYSPDGKWIAFKTIRDMTATWEAIHPDGTERSPFAARLGEIDWQPCSANCETLSPGSSSTKLDYTVSGVCGHVRQGSAKGVVRCYVLLGASTVKALKDNELEFRKIVGPVEKAVGNAVKTAATAGRSAVVTYALKKLVGAPASYGYRAFSFGQTLGKIATTAIIAQRWRDLGAPGFPPKCFHFQLTYQNQKGSVAFDPIWSFVRTWDAKNPSDRPPRTSLAHWSTPGESGASLPLFCKGADARAVLANSSSGLTALLAAPYLKFTIDFNR
jgi:WD40-like Beta Propeller Repeat